MTCFSFFPWLSSTDCDLGSVSQILPKLILFIVYTAAVEQITSTPFYYSICFFVNVTFLLTASFLQAEVNMNFGSVC